MFVKVVNKTLTFLFEPKIPGIALLGFMLASGQVGYQIGFSISRSHLRVAMEGWSKTITALGLCALELDQKEKANDGYGSHNASR